MRQARAGVLFTQLSGAISGLKDKPNELLCVRVQMRNTIHPLLSLSIQRDSLGD